MSKLYVVKHEFSDGEQVELFTSKAAAREFVEGLQEEYEADGMILVPMPDAAGIDLNLQNDFHSVYISVEHKSVRV